MSIIPALPSKPTVAPISDVIRVNTNTNQPYTVASGDTIYATSLQTLIETVGAGYVSPLTNNGTMWNEVSSASGWASLVTDTFGITNNGLMVLHVGPGNLRRRGRHCRRRPERKPQQQRPALRHQ